MPAPAPTPWLPSYNCGFYIWMWVSKGPKQVVSEMPVCHPPVPTWLDIRSNPPVVAWLNAALRGHVVPVASPEVASSQLFSHHPKVWRWSESLPWASINFDIRSSRCSFLAQICCLRLSLRSVCRDLQRLLVPFFLLWSQTVTVAFAHNIDEIDHSYKQQMRLSWDFPIDHYLTKVLRRSNNLVSSLSTKWLLKSPLPDKTQPLNERKLCSRLI